MTNFLKEKCKIKYFILPVIAVAILTMIVPSQVMAADGYKCKPGEIVLQVPIPVPGNQNDFCVSGFPEYIKRIYDFFIAIVGILTVIMMMYGGFQWLIAGGNPTKISGAKATILSALAGLCLTLSAYLILNLINPDLTKLKTFDYEKYSVNREDVVGAYCTNDTKIEGAEANRICGKEYKLANNSEGGTCKGFACEQDDGLVQRLTYNLINTYTWTICFDSAGCRSEYTLSNAGAMGYGVNAKVRTGIKQLTSITTFYCGRIYHTRGISTFPEDLQIGSYCDDGRTCLIDESKGYVINLSENQADNSGFDIPIVGQFNVHYCL